MDEMSADLVTLRSEGVAWSCALADFFEMYIDVLRHSTMPSPDSIHQVCRTLDTAGLGAYAATVHIRFGGVFEDENGTELVSKGTRFMVEQSIRDPDAFARVFAPN